VLDLDSRAPELQLHSGGVAAQPRRRRNTQRKVGAINDIMM